MDRDCIKLLTDKEFLNPFSQVHFSIKACKHSSRSKGKHGKQLEEDTGVGLHDLFLCQPSEGHKNPTCRLTFTEKAVTGAHTASQPYSPFNKDFFKGHCPWESIAISYFLHHFITPKTNQYHGQSLSSPLCPAAPGNHSRVFCLRATASSRPLL